MAARDFAPVMSSVMSTSVSLCLSVRGDISGTTRAIFTIFMHAAYGRGLVLIRSSCDTLCTSGFVDDIMFFL